MQTTPKGSAQPVQTPNPLAWPRELSMLARMDKARSIFGNDIADATFKKWLVYLLLLGLAVRAFYLIEHARSPSFGVLTLDQKYYDSAARMIIAGEDLHQLNGFRPLLYPMFLAVFYKIGGAHGVDLAIVTQHMLGVLTGLLVALMGTKLFGHRLSGIVGGAAYLLAPVPLYFEGELLIESSYVFLICAALLLLFRAVDNKKPGGIAVWVASGAAFVLIAQARPNILVFMSVFPLLAGWFWRHSRRLGSLLPLWGLAGGLAMSIAWGFVNRMQLDHFEILPSAGGVNLYFGNKRTADGMVPEQERRVAYGERYQDSGEIWAREEYAAAMRKEGRVPEPNPMAVSKYWTHRALEEIQAAPGSWLKLMAKKTWLLLWNAEIPNNKAFAFLQTEFTVLRFLPERWVVLLMLAPAGIWAAAKFGNRVALLILLTYLFVYGASDLLFFICDRYRYPLWPVMAALAGGGLWALVESLFNRRRLAWITFSMAVMAAISLPNWFDAKLPSFARDYLFRSIAWYEKGHFTEALVDCNRALELDPQEVTALHHRGNILLALHRYGDASQDYEQTLKIDRDDGGIWNNYGVALESLGRTNDALAAYAQATQCAPPSKSAFLAMAMNQILRGQTGEASRTLDQFEKLESKPNAIVLALRSVIAQKSGLSSQAQELMDKARRLDAGAASWAFDRVNTKK